MQHRSVVPMAVAEQFNPDAPGTAMLQERLEDLVEQASQRFLAAIEAEIERLLPLWPPELGDPVCVWGTGSIFLGLGMDQRLGEPGAIVVPARKIVLEVVS